MAAEVAPPPPDPNLAPPSEERGNVPGESTDQHAESLGEAFADLDTAFGEPAKPPVEPKPQAPAKSAAPAPKPEPPKPAQTPPKGPDGKFMKVPAAPKPDPKPADKPPEPEPKTPAELRKAYDRLKEKHAALEAERTKAASAPPPPEPQEDPEKKELSERLTAREKRLQELEQELMYTSYERSDEYKEKYEKPFIQAWQMGQQRTAALKVAEQRDLMDDVVAEGRQGTAEDFNALMQIANDDEAAEWAVKMFGPKASLVLYHREKVQEANYTKQQAVEEFRKNGSERTKQHMELMQKQQEAVRTLYHRVKDAAVEKYPQFFKPDDADPKTKELLTKGMRLADRAMGAPDVEGEKPLSGEDRVKLQAAMRNSFGAFQRVAYELEKLRKQNTELQKMIDQYEASEPKGGDGRAGGRPAGGEEESETPDAAFNARFGT